MKLKSSFNGRTKNTTTHPITLYLIGFAGTGKYTIAKEIAKSGYRIVDNHLINNPIFSLLDLDGRTPIPNKAWSFIADIRKAILGFVASDAKSNYIFTNELYNEKIDHSIYSQVKETSEKRGALFVPVKLLIAPDEQLRRITNPDRLKRLKTTNPVEIQAHKTLIKIKAPYLLEIDVTRLTPELAATEILTFVENIKHAQ